MMSEAGVDEGRARWSSKVGFVLAASGSAIGLGNIVFFGARAYEYGAGAFYLPYLLALFVIGLPILVTEMGLGTLSGKALPITLGEIGGKWGEFAGWWALANAGFITLYYIAILGWVCGMLLGSLGPLWQAETPLESFAVDSLANPAGFFFAMISSPWVILLVAVAWLLNLYVVRHGVQSIEPAVKLFVPLMWIFMILLIVRGITLPHGVEGVYLLFTPDFEVMANPEIWRGAVSQIFFSLTLGFGVMTAYASYLPKDADQVSNALVTGCLNCSFEFVAGVAIFTLLFTFAIVPQASTLAMIFFVMPEGIAAMPTGTALFGLLFFLLLLLAGLSSSISLLEGICCAMIDKFGWPRRRALTTACLFGFVGSALFSLPLVVDRSLAGNGTLGLSLLDVVDHWAFSHGLLIVGLVECILVGWFLPVSKLREHLDVGASFRIPVLFDWLIKLVIPVVLGGLLVMAVLDKLESGLYGADMALDRLAWLPAAAFFGWLLCTSVGALWLTSMPSGDGPRAIEEELV